MPAPVVPPAPGRFSITKVWPSCLPTWSITTRAITSLALPAPSGTTTVTLRAGQSCADRRSGGVQSRRQAGGDERGACGRAS